MKKGAVVGLPGGAVKFLHGHGRSESDQAHPIGPVLGPEQAGGGDPEQDRLRPGGPADEVALDGRGEGDQPQHGGDHGHPHLPVQQFIAGPMPSRGR
jgi:hypothetical protein